MNGFKLARRDGMRGSNERVLCCQTYKTKGAGRESSSEEEQTFSLLHIKGNLQQIVLNSASRSLAHFTSQLKQPLTLCVLYIYIYICIAFLCSPHAVLNHLPWMLFGGGGGGGGGAKGKGVCDSCESLCSFNYLL